MALNQTIEGQIELKCGADEFFDVWANKPYLVAKMSPNKVPKVELIDGNDWQEAGAVAHWTYVINGKRAVINSRVEKIDKENRFIRYNAGEGHIMKKFYKTLYSNIQAIPKGNEGCIVKWWFQYEKLTEDAPDPNMYLDSLFIGIAKDIDASLNHAN